MALVMNVCLVVLCGILILNLCGPTAWGVYREEGKFSKLSIVKVTDFPRICGKGEVCGWQSLRQNTHRYFLNCDCPSEHTCIGTGSKTMLNIPRFFRCKSDESML